MPFPLADALYAHLLDRFPPERAYPRGALYAEGMPPLVAGLLGRTLDRWLEHELDALESAWFDFNDPGVRAARAELVVALGRTARVPEAAWAETLRYAVGLVVRHLVTPARALTDATFEGETVGTLPTETVRARLHTFEAYPYLPEIADAWLAQKRPDHVTPDALFDLLTRIDRRVTAEYEPADWLRLLGPMVKLARSVPGLNGVSAEELALFFEAKGHDEAAARLAEREGEVIDESALRQLLLEVQPERPADAPPETTPSPEAEAPRPSGGSPPPAQPDRPAAPSAEVEEPETSPEPEPSGDTEASLEEVREPKPSEGSEVSRGPQPPREPRPSEEPQPSRALEPSRETEASETSRSEPPSPPTAPRPAPPERDVHQVVDSLDIREDKPPESEASDDDPEPLWKRFAGGDAAPPPRPAAAPAPPPAEPEEDEPPLWQRFLANLRGAPEPEAPRPSGSPPGGTPPPARSDRPLAPARPPDPLDTLEARVLGRSDARRRRRFVRELFRGDDAAYAAVLERLDDTESWTEASRVVAREVFRPFQVDIYSETAVEFTDAIQARFGG